LISLDDFRQKEFLERFEVLWITEEVCLADRQFPDERVEFRPPLAGILEEIQVGMPVPDVQTRQAPSHARGQVFVPVFVEGQSRGVHYECLKLQIRRIVQYAGKSHNLIAL
jgi:hypothetical protein